MLYARLHKFPLPEKEQGETGFIVFRPLYA